MNQTDSSFHRASSLGWQLLGELELAINTQTNRKVGKWLAVVLRPLKLRAAFKNKVLKSAQQSVAPTKHVEAEMQFRSIHILVFAQADHAANGYNWGFFRIEKIENAIDQDEPNYAIELYIYQEGQF